jgi:hypothetical protein
MASRFEKEDTGPSASMPVTNSTAAATPES